MSDEESRSTPPENNNGDWVPRSRLNEVIQKRNELIEEYNKLQADYKELGQMSLGWKQHAAERDEVKAQYQELQKRLEEQQKVHEREKVLFGAGIDDEDIASIVYSKYQKLEEPPPFNEYVAQLRAEPPKYLQHLFTQPSEQPNDSESVSEEPQKRKPPVAPGNQGVKKSPPVGNELSWNEIRNLDVRTEEGRRMLLESMKK